MQPVYALHAAEDVPATPSLTTSPLFSGVPAFTNGAAILFDSASDPDASKVPEGVTLSRLEVRFPDGTPDPDHLDPGLSLLLYVDDLSSPRARVRLADLVRQGGARPLNVRRLPGQVVRIVLLDPAGAWARNAPPVEVFLG
jgi:Ca-activated chloride channel family protein